MEPAAGPVQFWQSGTSARLSLAQPARKALHATGSEELAHVRAEVANW